MSSNNEERPGNAEDAGNPDIHPNAVGFFNTMLNNNNPNNRYFIRDQLFRTLFYKFAVLYAKTFSKPVRRFFEFVVLTNAVGAFFILVYIHMIFSRTPATCLDRVKDTWPRDGILRVEVVKDTYDYNIHERYEKDGNIKSAEGNDGNILPDNIGLIPIDPSTVQDDSVQETDPLDVIHGGNVINSSQLIHIFTLEKNIHNNFYLLMSFVIVDVNISNIINDKSYSTNFLTRTSSDVSVSSTKWNGLQTLIEEHFINRIQTNYKYMSYTNANRASKGQNYAKYETILKDVKSTHNNQKEGDASEKKKSGELFHVYQFSPKSTCL